MPIGVRNKHHFRPGADVSTPCVERIEPACTGPYDVSLLGQTEEGNFRLTFNSYEVKTEREDHGEYELIRRFYSNHCILEVTRRKR